MEYYYLQNGDTIKAKTVASGAHYVTKYENAWYRVRAIRVEELEVLCFFIDDGDELLVSKNDLYQLKREFAAEQAQACKIL